MIAGVDGCRKGWLVATVESWPCTEVPQLVVCEEFGQVLDATADCRVVMVDMPIGLPEGKLPRSCDIEARKQLGAAWMRIFYAPPHCTLDAHEPGEFQQRHREATGKGAGWPVWPLVKKLVQVNHTMTPALQERVKEFHPELAWQHLNGETPPISKHKQGGVDQRISWLSSSVPGIDQIAAWKRKCGRAVEVDDILDALVGLAAAQAFVDGPDLSRRLPSANPPCDERGLRMEIWF